MAPLIDEPAILAVNEKKKPALYQVSEATLKLGLCHLQAEDNSKLSVDVLVLLYRRLVSGPLGAYKVSQRRLSNAFYAPLMIFALQRKKP